MVSQYESKETLKLETIKKIANALDEPMHNLIDPLEYQTIEVGKIIDENDNEQLEKQYKKRNIKLIHDILTVLFQRDHKYKISYLEDGLNIVELWNTYRQELKDNDLKEIEDKILDYADFLLYEALKDKEKIKENFLDEEIED